jgi:hypothetical protein
VVIRALPAMFHVPIRMLLMVAGVGTWRGEMRVHSMRLIAAYVPPPPRRSCRFPHVGTTRRALSEVVLDGLSLRQRGSSNLTGHGCPAW